MENIIAALVLAALIGGAVVYLIKAKRNGVKCVGCPAGGSCPNRHKRKRKKLEGGGSARGDLSKGCEEISLDLKVGEMGHAFDKF